ncbi:unnamed protein product [Cylindrotheca closterium]|uniref:Uncharacterized protein n=1 Tax=Cylindrotheca closterium TaxID=2856 RepID=A0AAD2JH78_9STRA|nr:unnamed protein product [Cylindrotheca closterium]
MVARCKEGPINTYTTAKIELESDSKPQLVTLENMPRRVQFSGEHKIHEIPHIDDLSDEEIEQVWMSPDDFKDIRRECQKIIMIIEHDSSLLEGMGIELRGLEHHMVKQRKHIEGIQELLYDTVDRLMCFHDETSMDVGDMLAEMCQKISSRSEALARQIGIQDEEIAKKL